MRAFFNFCYLVFDFIPFLIGLFLAWFCLPKGRVAGAVLLFGWEILTA